jgi:hypothetical protein
MIGSRKYGGSIMSRTYRRKNLLPPKWVSHELLKAGNLFPWYWIEIKDKKKLKREIAKWRSDSGWHGDYGKSPSWWNTIYTESPNRRKERDILKKIPRLIDYEETPVFPLAKKPVVYYW